MSLSDFFNYGEMFIVICNIGLAFYYKILSYRFKKQHGQWMPSLRAKVIVDGMLGIEMLYACALYAWISAGSSEAIGGIESPSEFIYYGRIYEEHIFYYNYLLDNIGCKRRYEKFS
jgi:hypothetical protein